MIIGVGKTTLLNSGLKYFKKDANKNISSGAIGFDFYPFNIKIDDKIVKLNICKPNDDEKYHSLINDFYKKCSLVILIYAVDE